MNTAQSPQQILHWMQHRKKYYFLTQSIGVLLPVLTALLVLATENANWFWLTVIVFYFGTAVVDLIFGKDHLNLQQDDEAELKADKFYTNFLVLLAPGYLISLSLSVYATYAEATNITHYLAALIGIGVMFAGTFCVSHELGHRTKDKTLMLWARFSAALFGYGHFHIEHNRGHHVHVSTPEDAASARMGENVFQFMLRELPNTFKRAMRLEKERLARLNLGFWSTQNHVLQSYAMTIAIYLFLVLITDWSMLGFIILTSFFGYFQLTMANYLEHYGLLRQKLDNGRYEKCQPEHSWNSNHLFTNVLTLQLQRHSDHHANASREYQILRDYDNVPQLPAGYPFMQFLTVIPPLWRKIMDKRLLEFVDYNMDRVNLCPRKRDTLYKRYHKPASTSA